MSRSGCVPLSKKENSGPHFEPLLQLPDRDETRCKQAHTLHMVLVANAKIELEPMSGGSSESRSVRPFATNLNVGKSHSFMIGSCALRGARSLRLARASGAIGHMPGRVAHKSLA